MGLKIEMRLGHACPVVVCDHCANPIEKVTAGNVSWYPCPNYEGDAEPFFTHKACDRAFRRDKPPTHWMELAHFMVYLASSLAMGDAERKRAEETA